MIRKAGKLPGNTVKQTYEIEYGNAVMELSAVGGVKLLREKGYSVYSMVVY